MKPVDLQITVHKSTDVARVQSLAHHKLEEDIQDTAEMNNKQQELDRERCTQAEMKDGARIGDGQHHQKQQFGKKKKEKETQSNTAKDPIKGTHIDISL